MEDQPRCIKANPLSYAMHKKVDDTLDELLEEGVIEPVKFSEYACIMVAVNKSDDKARDCGNYLYVHYPIPSLEDMIVARSKRWRKI